MMITIFNSPAKDEVECVEHAHQNLKMQSYNILARGATFCEV